jgi:Raf kinase inhibitor-like YbhB/YbcL family protein
VAEPHGCPKGPIAMIGRDFGVLLAAALVCACSPQTKVDLSPKTSFSLEVSSPVFKANAPIPLANSAYGANKSPELNWSGIPPKTRALVLIVDDPDAPRGTFTHWVLYNLSAETTTLAAGQPTAATLNTLGAMQGKNDTGSSGYFGPRPPAGKPHHYHFRLFALDMPLGLQPGATRAQVERSMSGHVLARGELVAIFQKR